MLSTCVSVALLSRATHSTPVTNYCVMDAPFAGVGTNGDTGDDGPAIAAEFKTPTGMWVDSSSANLLVADLQYVRKVNIGDGIISKFAGGGAASTDPIDGIDATSSSVYLTPVSVCGDTLGSTYVVMNNGNNHNHVLKIGSDHIISNYAGQGYQTHGSDDIAATSSYLNKPNFCVVDSTGDLYMTEYYGSSVRKVDYQWQHWFSVFVLIAVQLLISSFVSGIITTLFGNIGSSPVDVSQPVTSAYIASPTNLCVRWSFM